MWIISRYLVRQFIRTYGMAFACLLGVYIVADFVGHLSEFTDDARGSRGVGETLLRFYGARVPWFLEITGHLVTLLAAVFVLGVFQRNHEMTALQAAGISRWTIVRPLVLAGAAIAIATAVNRELVVPHVREILCQKASEVKSGRPQPMHMRYDPETNVLFDGDTISVVQQRISHPRLRLPLVWPGVGKQIVAAEAEFLRATHDRPSGYLLRGVETATPLAQADSLRTTRGILVAGPKDCDWIPADGCFVYSRLPVEAFHARGIWQRYASTLELLAGVRDGRFETSPDTLVRLHARFVQPFLDVALLLLGLPFILSAGRQNVFAATAKSIAVMGAFSASVVLCHYMGVQGWIPPSLAAWMPLLTMIPLTVLVSGPLHA